MGRGRLRKGLSPLVATVVLISITILGGMLIYTYFQRSVDTMLSASQSVVVRASSVVLDSNNKIVYVELTNGFDKNIEVLEVLYVDTAGTIQSAKNYTIPTILATGEKFTDTIVIPLDARAILIRYGIDGKTQITEPVPIK